MLIIYECITVNFIKTIKLIKLKTPFIKRKKANKSFVIPDLYSKQKSNMTILCPFP